MAPMTLPLKKWRLTPLSELPLAMLLLAAGALATLVISGVVGRYVIFNKVDAMADQYGKALVNLAARQAVDATLIHDLVSLQVILSDIAENPGVINAAIYDVENNLLVQAGKIGATQRLTAVKQKNFTAPITLHDSVAGFVTVAVDTGDAAPLRQQLYWLFGFTAALVLAMFTAAFYVNRNRDTENDADLTIPIVNTDLREQKKVTIVDVNKEIFRVDMHLQFGNLSELNTQLSGSRFRDILRRLKKHIQGALSLYNGELIDMDLRKASMRFNSNESLADAVFQSICCARLLMELSTQEQDFDIKHHAAVVETKQGMEKVVAAADQEAQQTLLNNLFMQLPDNGILLQATFTEDDEVATKLVIDADFDAAFASVTAINEPYGTLIDKQRRKLQGSAVGLPIVNA